MGKSTFRGSMLPDDPMYSGGVEIFSKSDASTAQPYRESVTFVRRVTVNWDGDELQIDLEADCWSRIQAGGAVTLEELDENGELIYRWLFNVEPGHSLIVDFGDPNHLRWMGQLADANTTEINYQA